MRVVGRKAEGGVDPGFDRLRERVLEQLGLGVHLGEGDPERIDQVALEKTVVAEDLERDEPPAFGQPDAPVRRPCQQPLLVQSLGHRRDGRRGHAEAAREGVRAGPARGVTELEHGLEEVLCGAREALFAHICR